MLLRAHDVGKRYGSRWLFRHVEMELMVGDAILVSGPNGSGKSTLLRALAGLLTLSEGQVKWESDRRTSLGYAALDGRLYDALTPAEHWRFAADARSATPKSSLEPFGLPDIPAKALSSGQRSRLRLALATQMHPAVLILDEPGASLDEPGRELVARLIAEQTQRGALILATNDPAERRYGRAELALA